MNPSDEPQPTSDGKSPLEANILAHRPYTVEEAEKILADYIRDLRAQDPQYDADCIAEEQGRLIHRELFWRDHYHWLNEKGYLLQPRYHPEWVLPDKPFAIIRDGHPAWSSDEKLYATRIRDGSKVILKKVKRNSDEAEIIQIFSNAAHSSNTANHCVPVYDYFDVPGDEETSVSVMPSISSRGSVAAVDTVGEAVEVMRQMIEGLQFMHTLHVAHKNSTGLRFNDIDMCASPLGGPDARPDREREWCFNRTLNPVRYYYTSLSELQKYAPDATFRTEVGYEYDIYVPEFLRQEDCDPFAADVYRLGHSFRADFTEGWGFLGMDKKWGKKRGLEFMKPLLDEMCHAAPLKRPSMTEVVARFAEIVKGLSGWKLRSRVIRDDELLIVTVTTAPAHWARQVSRIVRRIPAIPTA